MADLVTDPEDFDHGWLTRLTGRHRIVFDVKILGDAVALRRARNYLDAVTLEHGANPDQVQAVLALHGAAAPIALNDAAWARYGLGERSRVNDPGTGTFATRNIFASETLGDPWTSVAVPALQRRGAIFLFCNNVLRFLSAQLARQRNEDVNAVRADLIASFLPGVVLVPAVVAATAMAQERGCAYSVIN